VSKRRQFILITGALVAAAAVTLTPYGLRTGLLWWTKSSAKRAMKGTDAATMANLNKTPTLVQLATGDEISGPSITIETGGFIVRVMAPLPTPTTSAIGSGNSRSAVLAYPRFQVTIRPPFSTAEFDAAAKQLGFKDVFDLRLASMNTRWDDLDSQSDSASLRQFLRLIAQKPSRTYCREFFVGSDLRGFIFAPLPDEHRTIAEVFIPAYQASCGVWFMDQGALRESDIHEFLATLKFKPRHAPTTASTQNHR
jgi:hypothetical protein